MSVDVKAKLWWQSRVILALEEMERSRGLGD
jgi:hypothetical protein